MTWLLSILIVLLTLLFILPIELEVDSEKAIYRLRWRGIFGIRLSPMNDRLRWYLSLFFFEKEIHPKLPARKPKTPQKRSKNDQKKTMRLTPRKMFLLLKNTLKAIRVRRMEVNIDTDDVIRNAYLIPIFFHLSRGPRKLRINFTGQRNLAIQAHTSLWRLARAALHTFIK